MTDKYMQRDTFNKGLGRRRTGFNLRMAPMIDMIFLLLIFFLVAAKWRPQENFLPFQLPTAQAQGHQTIKPEPLQIYISPTENGCKVSIAQLYTVDIENQTAETDLTAMMEKVKQTLVSQKRFSSDPVEIACEPQVKWEHLAKIYNIFFGAGLTDITFVMTE